MFNIADAKVCVREGGREEEKGKRESRGRGGERDEFVIFLLKLP